MTSRAAQLLGRPFTLGSAQLRNRIVMAPMTRVSSPGGIPGDDVARYYARRAAAGAGLIIGEATYIDHPSAGSLENAPRFYGDGLAGWSNVVQSVHAAGGLMIPQLWHEGIQRVVGHEPFPEAPSVGPSGIDRDGVAGAGEALSLSDVEDLIRIYADAAETAERIGFDGVELHGGHGYLIDQFFWELTNRRTDSYGGDLRSRTRFGAEVVAAVRERVSADFPILFRFSQWKGADHYADRLVADPGELETLLQPLVDAGVDAFHASSRRYWEPEFPETGLDLNLAGWAKKVTGKPAITVGSVGLDTVMDNDSFGPAAYGGVESIDRLVERLERDEFDLVAVGRAILADPDWAAKVLEGREAEATPFTIDAVATLLTDEVQDKMGLLERVEPDEA